MSEASRAHALQHAATVHAGSGDAATTLETAEAFHEFIIGGAEPAAAPVKVAAPAKGIVKAAAKAPAKAPKSTPVEDAEAEAAEGDVTKEEVGAAIEALLNANMRDEAKALFKKYKAVSLSGLKPEDYAAVKAEAEDLAMNA